MKLGLIMLAIFVIIIAILLFAPVRLKLNFYRDGVENEVKLVLSYLRFKFVLFDNKNKKSKKDKPKKEKEPFSYEKEKARLEKYINIFEETKADIGKILKYTGGRALVFENVKVHTEFGFSDAMHTGIFTGAANGFVYSVLGFIHHKTRLLNMDVQIQPVFDKTCFLTDCECIVRSKNAHIIIIALNVLRILRKIRKFERRG